MEAEAFNQNKKNKTPPWNKLVRMQTNLFLRFHTHNKAIKTPQFEDFGMPSW